MVDVLRFSVELIKSSRFMKDGMHLPATVDANHWSQE